MDALSTKIKVVTSKTLGTDAESAAKPIIKKISSLWRGSLISEEEMEKIRSQRESRRTDTDRAHDLYWSMYHDRAAAAFGEVTEEVKEAGGGISAWERERAGKRRAEPVSALAIQEELDDISASLAGARQADDGGDGAWDVVGGLAAEGAAEGVAKGVVDEEEIAKSDELIELEALVREQRDSRR